MRLEYYIIDEELTTLKNNKVLSSEHINFIQKRFDDTFDCYEHLISIEELEGWTDEEIQELNKVVS